jgi:outer membrane protein assembly factor BamB
LKTRPFIVALGAAAVLSAAVGRPSDGPRSTDWPGLWGPSRDGVTATRLGLGATPKARVVWRRPIGSGFSGIAVAGSRGFTGESDGTDDHAVAFDLATGREAWRVRLGPTYRGHDGSKDGPISTPTLDEGRAYILGPKGLLLALDAATGRVLWRHDLKTEFGAPEPSYGFGASPLVSGSRLIVQAGGTTHNLAAFDKVTGKLLWAANHSKVTGYASPVLGTLGGRTQVVVHAGDSVYGASPEDGTLLWTYSLGAAIESDRPPLVLPGDRVLLSRWEDSRLLQIEPGEGALKAREVWKSPRLRASYSPTILHEGHLYAMGGPNLMCVDPANGNVVWREKVYPGSLILVDGQLLHLGEQSGELRVALASAAGYKERLKTPVFNAGATSTTTPSFGSGRVLMRNVEEIVALELK